MIGSIGSYSTAQTGGAMAFKAASTTERVSDASENQGASGAQGGGTQSISTLARQLAVSAGRAEERDKTLSRTELGDKAKKIVDQLVGYVSSSMKFQRDNEIPKTNDPELLARAKQATVFFNNPKSEKNPFAALSSEQLSIIAYDDSGTYTINERSAAYYESYNREEAWRVKVVAQGQLEYNDTGKMTNFFSSVLDHFKELPAIEQAQYPKDYASDLQSKIDLDFNYRTHQAEGKGKDPMSLIGMLFEQNPQQTNELPQEPKNPTDLPTVRSNP